MKKVLLIAFMLSMVPTVGAQTSIPAASGASECKLKLAQAPVIRGIRLGMTVNEVLAVFPGAEKDEALRQGLSRERFGSTGFSIDPSIYGSKDKFVGVNSVHFGFLDGVLNSFSVWYNGPEFTSEQFVSRIVGPLNLPGIEFWKQGGGTGLVCEGFTVRVTVGGQMNAIYVRNLEKDANRVVREREEAVKEEARRAFKP